MSLRLHSLRRVALAAFLFPLVSQAASTLRPEELPAEMIEQGYGTPQVDKTVAGNPIVMGGVRYPHGLGTHAKSLIALKLDGSRAKFTGVAGLPDDVRGSGARVEFIVEGDGKRLWKSGRIAAGDAPKPFSVDLTGVKHLKLIVTDGGNGIGSDHAVWADSRIETEGRAPESDILLVPLAAGDVSFSLRVKDGVPMVGFFGKSGGASVFSGPAYPSGTEMFHRNVPVRATYADGVDAVNLRYVSHTETVEAPGVRHVAMLLRDIARPLEVTLHYRAHAAGVMEQWVEARNRGDKPVRIDALASAYMPFASDHDVYATFFENEWGQEMRRVPVKLGAFAVAKETRALCRHVTGAAPNFVLGFGKEPGEESGSCVLGSLAWTGNTRLLMEKGPEGGAHFMAGVLPEGGAYTLDPDATLTTPVLTLAYSDCGLSAASRKLHAWARATGAVRSAENPRPIDNNSWEGAGFDVGEARLRSMIEGSADLGIELYLLDDGWFGNGEYARNGDNAGLGDWQLNTRKIPSLDRIIEACESRGMKFGIWVEPEMVNERSNLFVAHPDWVLRHPDRAPFKNRNQLVLDLSNPEVQEFVFKSVDDLLTRYPKIAYVKWDSNSDANAPHSRFLAKDRQGDLPWRYIQGLYSVMHRLTAKHTKVAFQACASGGGHADYGAMRYNETFWPSDNTGPDYRLKGAWDYSLFFPAQTITSHMTHSGGNFPAKYRADISFFGQFGLELDPKNTDEAYSRVARVAIADYKRVRDVIQLGDQYRTRSPHDGPVAAVNYVSSDRSRAVLLGYRAGSPEPDTQTLPIRGLDPKMTYRLRELNLVPGERPRLAGTVTELTGAELLEKGVVAEFRGERDSIGVELSAK